MIVIAERDCSGCLTRVTFPTDPVCSIVPMTLLFAFLRCRLIHDIVFILFVVGGCPYLRLIVRLFALIPRYTLPHSTCGVLLVVPFTTRTPIADLTAFDFPRYVRSPFTLPPVDLRCDLVPVVPLYVTIYTTFVPVTFCYIGPFERCPFAHLYTRVPTFAPRLDRTGYRVVAGLHLHVTVGSYRIPTIPLHLPTTVYHTATYPTTALLPRRLPIQRSCHCRLFTVPHTPLHGYGHLTPRLFWICHGS